MTRPAHTQRRSTARPWRDRRGATALVYALGVTPAVALMGLAVDVGRAQYASMRMEAALDSAALALGASGDVTDAQAKEIIRNFVTANVPNDVATLTDDEVMVEVTREKITVSVSAEMPTVFLPVLALLPGDQSATYGSMTISSRAEVVRATNALMVALVLDNTGSMWSNNNIDALRGASLAMVDQLHEGLEDANELKIGVVPYAASVNPGAAAVALVDPATNPPTPSADLLGWKGCVVERGGAESIADTPASAGRYWTRFIYPADSDNRWEAGQPLSVEPGGNTNSNGFRGPNLGCPTAILPLTSDRARVDQTLTSMTAWNRGGTLTDIGLAWGIRVLSPGAPFTESAETDHVTGDILAESDRWARAIVLMTDGESLFYKMPGSQNPTNTPPSQGYSRPANTAVASNLTDFTGYGRLGDTHASSILGTTDPNTARNRLNERIEALCTQAKADGVTMFTLVFTSGVSQSVRNMYQRCASDPGKYWYAPDQNALRSAFNQIGRELSQLRVER